MGTHRKSLNQWLIWEERKPSLFVCLFVPLDIKWETFFLRHTLHPRFLSVCLRSRIGVCQNLSQNKTFLLVRWSSLIFVIVLNTDRHIHKLWSWTGKQIWNCFKLLVKKCNLGEKWGLLGAFSRPSYFSLLKQLIKLWPLPLPTIAFTPTRWWSINSEFPACSVLCTLYPLQGRSIVHWHVCAGFSGFTIGSLEVREFIPPTSRKCKKFSLCVLNCLQILKERGYTCAALLQSSTNPSTHNDRSEIINKKKVELEGMWLCNSPEVYFSPWKINFSKYEAGESGLCMLLLSLLPF